MKSRVIPAGTAREWLVALCSYALLVAPFGCQLQDLLLNPDSTLGPESTGFFVNSDLASPILVGGRNAAGDSFFVYGTRDGQGALATIESIRVVTADGSDSYLAFESNRPVYARGPDGSYLTVTYNQVDPLHLSATVAIHGADGSQDTRTVDVDLTETAAHVADMVQSVTGRTLETPIVPSQSTGKPLNRELGIFAAAALGALFAIPVALAVQACVVILGQVLTAVFEVVALAMRAMLLVIFSPLYLISALLNDVVIDIRLVGLPQVFITLPEPPTIILD